MYAKPDYDTRRLINAIKSRMGYASKRDECCGSCKHCNVSIQNIDDDDDVTPSKLATCSYARVVAFEVDVNAICSKFEKQKP